MKSLRKWIWLPLLVLLFTCATAVYAEEVIYVKSLKLSVKQLTVKTGETTEPVAYTMLPENATNTAVLWTSDDETIATVSENGQITGISAGKTRIHLTAADQAKGAKSAVLNVTVVQPVLSITTDVTDTEIGVGSRIRINAEVLPENATNRKLTWTSSDQKIATVSGNGDVTGRKAGEAVITATAADGSGIVTSVNISVFQPVKGLKLSAQKLNAFVGKTSEPLVVTILPENAKYQGYTWSSSDESIATVNEKGEVTGIAPGTVKITATSAEPVSGKNTPKAAVCQVKVTQSVLYIGLAKDEDKSTDRKLVLKLTVLPETATDKGVTWTTSDKKIATVNNGTVKVKKREGNVTITATAKDGSGIYATCDLRVGFSGSRLQIGNRVWEQGVYTWLINGFDGNGEMPGEPEKSEEETVPNDAVWEEIREVIEFGHYEQDNMTTNGKEPVKWLVLDKTEDKMLLLSVNVLDGCKFDKERDYPTWYESDVRQWLNNTFLKETFDDDEKKCLVQSSISTPDYENPEGREHVEGGKDTKDYIFCLSREEAMICFFDEMDRRAVPTPYAVSWNIEQSSQYSKNGEGCAAWWLRSPGGDLPGTAYHAPYGVLASGELNMDWTDGAATVLGIRPAVWVDTELYNEWVNRSN